MEVQAGLCGQQQQPTAPQKENNVDNLRTKATDEYDSQYFLKHNEIALYLHYEVEQGKESFL